MKDMDDEQMTEAGRNLSTGEAARRIGTTAVRLRKLCEKLPGFAIRLGAGWWEVPPEHIDRLLAGDRAEDIAADALAAQHEIRVARLHRQNVA